MHVPKPGDEEFTQSINNLRMTRRFNERIGSYCSNTALFDDDSLFGLLRAARTVYNRDMSNSYLRRRGRDNKEESSGAKTQPP